MNMRNDAAQILEHVAFVRRGQNQAAQCSFVRNVIQGTYRRYVFFVVFVWNVSLEFNVNNNLYKFE